jgi:hypothetical protein
MPHYFITDILISSSFKFLFISNGARFTWRKADLSQTGNFGKKLRHRVVLVLFARTKGRRYLDYSL